MFVDTRRVRRCGRVFRGLLVADGGLFEGVDFSVVNGVASSKGRSLKIIKDELEKILQTKQSRSRCEASEEDL